MERKLSDIENIKPNKIDIKDYEIGGTIGSGQYSKVKVVQHKKTKEYYAVKAIEKAELIKFKQVDHIIDEVRIMSCLDHPFIVFS